MVAALVLNGFTVLVRRRMSVMGSKISPFSPSYRTGNLEYKSVLIVPIQLHLCLAELTCNAIHLRMDFGSDSIKLCANICVVQRVNGNG